MQKLIYHFRIYFSFVAITMETFSTQEEYAFPLPKKTRILATNLRCGCSCCCRRRCCGCGCRSCCCGCSRRCSRCFRSCLISLRAHTRVARSARQPVKREPAGAGIAGPILQFHVVDAAAAAAAQIFWRAKLRIRVQVTTLHPLGSCIKKEEIVVMH